MKWVGALSLLLFLHLSLIIVLVHLFQCAFCISFCVCELRFCGVSAVQWTERNIVNQKLNKTLMEMQKEKGPAYQP